MPKGATSTIGTVSEPAGCPRLGVYLTDVTTALSSSDAQVELQAVTKEPQAVTSTVYQRTRAPLAPVC